MVWHRPVQNEAVMLPNRQLQRSRPENHERETEAPGSRGRKKALWRYSTQASSISALEAGRWIDTTPSVSYVKNPFTMGIFTTSSVQLTHASGVGSWRPPASRCRFFSVPTRFDWISSYSVFHNIVNRALRARMKWVTEGSYRISPPL